jgi:acylpyruvate hydrolase
MLHPAPKNVWAVGRNYADHALELKNEVPTTPFIFLKSGSCVHSENTIHLPTYPCEIHHEIELAFLIDAHLNLSHVALALDLTDRTAQTVAKNKGLPWTLAKSFTGSCPVGPWIPYSPSLENADLFLTLNKNNLIAQKGHIKDMIFNPQALLQFIKTHFPVQPYDILLTGTPAGVSDLKSGDILEGQLNSKTESLLACHWNVI